jgi:hypothetical protein
MFLSWRRADVPVYGVSGDDPKARESGDDPVPTWMRSCDDPVPTWMRSCDDPVPTWRKAVFEEPRAPNSNILGPIFTPKAILGGFLVLFWTSILGGSVPGCSLTLTAVYIDVFGRSRLVFEDSVNSGLNWPFSQCPPC